MFPSILLTLKVHKKKPKTHRTRPLSADFVLVFNLIPICLCECGCVPVTLVSSNVSMFCLVIIKSNWELLL